MHTLQNPTAKPGYFVVDRLFHDTPPFLDLPLTMPSPAHSIFPYELIQQVCVHHHTVQLR